MTALESARERPCSKVPWSSRAIGFNRACRPARSSSPPRNPHQAANRHSTGPMLGNSALSINESFSVFRDEMVSCVELTRRNTRVDVRWFLSSLFVGKLAHPSRSGDVKIEVIAKARNRDSLLCGTCGTPIMGGISSGQPGGTERVRGTHPGAI